MYIGDFRTGVTIDHKFTTRQFSTGTPFTLAGTPAISVYKDNSTSQSTSGVTLSADFDSVTGLNNVRVDTSSDGTFYAAGSNFQLVITAGTVDSVSVVGEVIGSFSLENRSALMPTTAGRKLDVSAGGEAGVDWANVGSPTTVVGLSGTTVKTATDVETDTQDIQGRLPAALTGAGNIKADALAISGDATAADNAESFFDGTGYAGTNNTIPTVTDVTNEVSADVTAISGDSTAADRLEALMDGIIVAQVNDASATTTSFIADGFTEATNDHFNGRLITFISGALSGQQTAITDYVGATQTFTVTALTEAPADDDFFVIH
jgi:hypothetical protein